MTPTQYQELKKRIQELVPDIMHLQLGSVVYKTNHWTNVEGEEAKRGYGVVFGRYTRGSDDHWKDTIIGVVWQDAVTYSDTMPHYFTNHLSEGVRNLGRPIRLADVLLSMQKSGTPHLVDANGIFYNLKLHPKNIGRAWIVERDSLDDQSDETKQVLYDILISKAKK